MNAHLFNDGGGMVTGTGDIEAARRLLKETWLHDHGARGENLEDWEEAALSAFDAIGSVETGRIIPAPRDDLDGNSWYWHAGYKPGAKGVTTAVVFRDPLIISRNELVAALKSELT
jgi:hypothetical protein